jgi:transcriptional regulator GlxA family with amidase domain
VIALEELLLVMQSSGGETPLRSDERYQAFAFLTEKISSRPEQHWDFEKEARKLSVSYAHFRRLFEEFFQVPPGAFLLAARLEKAAALLTGTNLPIRRIAHECGFEDEFYFSRIFKKYRKYSPKNYREKNQY